MKTLTALLIVGLCSLAHGQDDDPFAGFGGGFFTGSAPTNLPKYVPEVWTNTGAFARLIAKADRVVIRNGGFDCCGPVDDDDSLAVLTNAQAVAAFNSTITLVKTQEVGFSCMCCGFPGVDWYQGTNRLALTGIQHGEALRWKGFPSDIAFTPESSRALAKWFLDHNIPDRHGELKKIVNKENLPTTKSTLSSEAAPNAAPSER